MVVTRFEVELAGFSLECSVVGVVPGLAIRAAALAACFSAVGALLVAGLLAALLALVVLGFNVLLKELPVPVVPIAPVVPASWS